MNGLVPLPRLDNKTRLYDMIRGVLAERSSVSLICGEEEATSRVCRASRHAWEALPAASRPSLNDYTETRLTVTPGYQQYGLPPDCVIFQASPPVIEHLDAPLYGDGSLPPYHVLDARVPYGYSVIHSNIGPSYAQWSQRRSRSVQARVNPVPILFFQRDAHGACCFGVSVEHAADGEAQLVNGDYELDVLKKKTSLKIKFGWVGHGRTGEKQIRGTARSPLRNLNRLAKLTAGAVRNFMADGGPTTTIKGLGEFGVRDVRRLGVIFIGDGAATPLLAVRYREPRALWNPTVSPPYAQLFYSSYASPSAAAAD